MPFGFGGGAMALATIPFWDPAPDTAEGDTFAKDSWDSVFLDGKQLPGVGTVKCEPKVVFDLKHAPGFDGAVITMKGYLPGAVVIELRIWTKAQWVEFLSQLPRIWRKPGKPSLANQSVAKAAGITPEQARDIELSHTISHPALNPFLIESVIVAGISTPEDAGAIGVKVIRIKCQEYVLPARKAPSKIRHRPDVALAPELNPPRNAAGAPPHKTDINPGGPAVSRVGGSG
jgi:hypothetical protein